MAEPLAPLPSDGEGWSKKDGTRGGKIPVPLVTFCRSTHPVEGAFETYFFSEAPTLLQTNCVV